MTARQARLLVDTNLLRSWLGLPPGDWPPEPFTLLGHGEGAQERALALMERLRPHQLRHPELVTEGMNRLAQALIAIEDSSPVKQAENPPNAEPIMTTLEAEVIATPPQLKSDRPRIPPRKRRRTLDKPVATPPAEIKPRTVPKDRRNAYRNLVALRQMRKAWEMLGPTLGVPSQNLLTSSEILQYLQAVIVFRTARARFNNWPIQGGLLVRDVIENSGTLAVIRSLQRKQRRSLAADWASAYAEWQSEEASLRLALRATKPRGTRQRRMQHAAKWCKTHPEWKLIALLSAAILLALIKTWH